MTQRINRLKGLEDQLASGLQGAAQTLRDRATRRLWLTGVGGLVIFAATTLTASASARRLTGWLRQSASEFYQQATEVDGAATQIAVGSHA
jgi:hypothetical protein